MDRFQNKTVFVTGAAGGIGEFVARRFLAEGANVVAADLDPDRIRPAADRLGTPDRVLVTDFNICNDRAASTAMQAAEAHFGAVDFLVNCAGVASIVGTVDLSADDWRRVHAINVDGTFFASQAFARQALSAGRAGAIVNLASVAGLLAIPDRPAYISSKHAVVGLTREMAMELGKDGVRVNAVAPGVIHTPMTDQHFLDPERADRIKRAHAGAAAVAPRKSPQPLPSCARTMPASSPGRS